MAAARTVYLVRHGEAAASWETAVDPGLSAAGQQQARALLDKQPVVRHAVMDALRMARGGKD